MHSDHLGTPRIITDINGLVVSEHHYLPFGEEVPPSSHNGVTNQSNNSHRFTGHERDSETNLDYMMARYYEAGLGRFLSVDPDSRSARPENPQTWNRYAYVLNNPIRFTDPQGTLEQETKKVFAEVSTRSNDTKVTASAGAVETKVSGAAGTLTVGVATVQAETHSTGSTNGSSVSGSIMSAQTTMSTPGGALKNDSSLKALSVGASGEATLGTSGGKVKSEVSASLVEASTTSSVTFRVPFTSVTVTLSFTAGGGVGAAAGLQGGAVKTDSGGIEVGGGVKGGAPLFGAVSASLTFDPKK